MNVQVSDTTGGDSSTIAGKQKFLSDIASILKGYGQLFPILNCLNHCCLHL